MSGLSELCFSIASLYDILGKGILSSSAIDSLNTYLRSFSIVSKISSSSVKESSMSSCVNSGCLSERRSSSLKHFAIWKYLSNPDTINNCLNNCGDCGSAKNFPLLSLDGTRKSLAPSGVDFVSMGVSTSIKSFLSRKSLIDFIILCRKISFFWTSGLLISIYLYLNLTSSEIFPALSNSKGGVRDGLIISSSFTPSSTSPVGMFGFSVPLGLC